MSHNPSSCDRLLSMLARGWVITLSISLKRPDGVVLPRPGVVTFSSQQLLQEPGMPFRITATLPTPSHPDDVKARRITVAVDGAAETSHEIDPAATSFVFPDLYQADQILTGALIDNDGHNDSEPSPYEYTVTDTTPPETPGALSFASEQVFDGGPTA